MTGQKKLLLGTASLLALLLLIWLGNSIFGAPDIRNLDSTGTTIIAFGDSLVEGVGATEGNDFVSLLSRKLGTPIVKLGKSGDTTRDGLERVTDVIAQNPRLVILLLGGNDYLKRVPTQETMENLGEIITAIQNRGASVLLLGVRGGLLRDSYNSRYKEVAQKYNTGFVSNVLDDVLGDSKLMSDAIHPNDLGYAKIAEKVEPTLRQMLRR